MNGNILGLTEMQILMNNKKLDMLIEHKENGSKIYVKYHLSTLNQQKIYDYVDELFYIEEILKPGDELLIILKEQNINKTLKEIMSHIYTKDNIFVNIRKIEHYLFNILKHTLVLIIEF